jgi:primosomal replication protein N
LNQFTLAAKIAQKSMLRYTPTGLPALDLVLEHESKAIDALVPRDVSLIIKAVAFGTTAEILAKATVGQTGNFSGFLNNARGGRGTSFHIQIFHP